MTTSRNLPPASTRAAILFLALVCLLFGQGSAGAQNLTLSNMVMDNQRGDLTLRFSLAVDEVDKLRALLQDGAFLALKCQATLALKRGYLPSKNLVSVEERRVLSANALTQEFILEINPPRALRNKNLAALLAEGWGHMEINLGPFSVLQRGASYAVNLEVLLIEADIPAWMRWALFFKSWEVAPSASYRMDFEF
jgi:hypothetical protein